jgi:protein-L-isoaspartate(D-aspartate) O-methyltransferase
MKHIYSSRREILLKELGERGICDQAVLEAIKKVPREEFVPENLQDYAYENMSLSIGCEQTISSPYIVAYMLQEASLDKTSKVLEIGTGSGYQTAILSLLCKKVYSIEIIPALAVSAKTLLKKLGYYAGGNIKIEVGNGYFTKYENNFFDAIIVTAAPASIEKHFKEILKINGRLIVPVGDRFAQQKLLKVTKHGEEEFTDEVLCDVKFVPMVK